MWIEKISLKNIKCFKDTTLSFETNGGLYRWITLLGENGTGKSSILKAIALLLSGPQSAKQLFQFTPDGWLHDTSKIGEISATIQQNVTIDGVAFTPATLKEQIDERNYTQKNGKIFRSFPFSYYLVDRGIIYKDVSYDSPDLVDHPSTWLNWLRNNALREDSMGWFASGYGAFRRVPNRKQMGGAGKITQSRMTNFLTQFDEKVELTTLDQWIGNQTLLSTGGPKEIRDQANATLRRITEIIPHFLPRSLDESGNERFVQMGYIDPATGERVFFDATGELVWQLEDGLKVSTSNLSDGYRSILAFTGDLVVRLALAFPHLKDPSQAPGVVLVDELDVHLHPAWQRQIAQWLQEKFPNIQFIVSTHSPFVAAGAGDKALTLRFKQQADQVIYETVGDISPYDVDDVLRSPAFDLRSTHAPQTQEAIHAYYEARRELKKHARGSSDYQAIQQKMEELEKLVAIAQNDFVRPGSLNERIENYIESKR